jgi:hypothetical protein
MNYCAKQKAIVLLDVVLSRIKIHKHYLQLLAITCILITVKAEENFMFDLADACKHCENAYTKDEVLNMEMVILKALKWKINYPTPGEIARYLLKLSDAVLDQELPLLYKKIDEVIDNVCLGNASAFITKF